MSKGFVLVLAFVTCSMDVITTNMGSDITLLILPIV